MPSATHSLNCQNQQCTRRDTDGDIKFMKCGACKKVSYCSKPCQVAHWKEHKPICKVLRNNSNLPDMDDITPRIQELEPMVYGRHAPATTRINFLSLDGRDPDSRRAKIFADNLDYNDVNQYAVEKFLETADKGAVVFNIKYPYMNSAVYSRLCWLPRAVWVNSRHPLLAREVTEYDPAHQSVIFFALPSQDGLSMKLWSREVLFSIPDPTISRRVVQTKRTWEESMRIWALEGLLEPED